MQPLDFNPWTIRRKDTLLALNFSLENLPHFSVAWLWFSLPLCCYHTVCVHWQQQQKAFLIRLHPQLNGESLFYWNPFGKSSFGSINWPVPLKGYPFFLKKGKKWKTIRDNKSVQCNWQYFMNKLWHCWAQSPFPSWSSDKTMDSHPADPPSWLCPVIPRPEWGFAVLPEKRA